MPLFHSVTQFILCQGHSFSVVNGDYATFNIITPVLPGGLKYSRVPWVGLILTGCVVYTLTLL